MFKYIYYSKGNGSHNSGDDVAIIRAWSKRQALRILRKYCEVEKLNHYELYRPMFFKKHHNHRIQWISEY